MLDRQRYESSDAHAPKRKFHVEDWVGAVNFQGEGITATKLRNWLGSQNVGEVSAQGWIVPFPHATDDTVLRALKLADLDRNIMHEKSTQALKRRRAPDPQALAAWDAAQSGVGAT